MKTWEEFCAEPNRHKVNQGGEIYRFISRSDYEAIQRDAVGRGEASDSDLLKFCHMCKHCCEVGTIWNPIKGCGVEGLTDLTDGKNVYRRCSWMRGESGKCGQDGKLFEARS